SLYVQTARWDRSTFAMLFDAANPDASVEKRNVSTVAPQALMIVKNASVQGQATEWAKRLLREADGETKGINRAYQLLFARPARKEDYAIARDRHAKSGQPQTEAAWRDLAHVLLCSNEFIYVD